jgi:NAD(P)H-flavin reductase
MSVSPCFDAGSPYCPCQLAELGQCVACSFLRGEETCTCGWSGLCVYTEFLRERAKARPRRRMTAATLLTREDISGNSDTRAFMFDVRVGEELTVWCDTPGSFVLVRPKGSPERFNVPVSVMVSSEAKLTLAVQVVGPKTAALDRACREERAITLVGPFWSGLQGLSHLKRVAGGRVLVVAKGIAQSCAVPVTKYVADRGGFVKALLGGGPLDRVFAQVETERAGASVEVLPKVKDHNLARVFAELVGGKYDLLVSAGADIQHRSLKGLLDGMEDPPCFAWTSNLSMTCAEGICGSCLSGGFRGCKAQLPAGVS